MQPRRKSRLSATLSHKFQIHRTKWLMCSRPAQVAIECCPEVSVLPVSYAWWLHVRPR